LLLFGVTVFISLQAQKYLLTYICTYFTSYFRRLSLTLQRLECYNRPNRTPVKRSQVMHGQDYMAATAAIFCNLQLKVTLRLHLT